jgi:hypothetical protein
MTVMIVLALAVVAVLAAIVVLAMGKGGELGHSHPDHTSLELPRNRLAGTDVVLLRLPLGLFGYHTGVTNEALQRVAGELTDRDTRIAILEQRLAEAQERLAELDSSQARPPRPRAGDLRADAGPSETDGPTNVRLTSAVPTNARRTTAAPSGAGQPTSGGRSSNDGHASTGEHESNDGHASTRDRAAVTRTARTAAGSSGRPARAEADEWGTEQAEEEAW